MAEVTIGGNNYRTGKMDAMTQFHVVRRLLPIISSLTNATQDTAGTQSTSGAAEVNGADGAAGTPVTNRAAPSMEQFLQALVNALAKLSDEDCEFIIAKCLTTCRRQQGAGWSIVWNVAAKRPQYEDIDLGAMMNLTTETLQENLAGFMPALPFGLVSGNSPPSAQ